MNVSSSRSAGPSKGGVAFLLAQIGAHAAARFAERLKPHGLSPAHAGILRAINSQGGISQQKLAKFLGMFPSRLVLVLDEMERAGLLERKASAGDRRAYALHLTAQGTERLQAIGRLAQEHQDNLCAALNANERETLLMLLSKIAGQQGLTPGVHPGYRDVGRAGKGTC